jgi:serine/threonine protein kinase
VPPPPPPPLLLLLLLLLPQPHQQARMTTTMGTPAFMAPEMCGLRSTPFAPFPAEVWAVGVCLYMFVFGKGEALRAASDVPFSHLLSPFPSCFSQLHAAMHCNICTDHKPCRLQLNYVVSLKHGQRVQKTAKRNHDAASNICVLCVLCAVPYVSSSTGALYEAIRSPAPVVLPEQPPISPQLTALLSRLLDKDPATRIQLAEVSCSGCFSLQSTHKYHKVRTALALWLRASRSYGGHQSAGCVRHNRLFGPWQPSAHASWVLTLQGA